MRAYYASFNRFNISLPADAVADCSGPGRADESVEYWHGLLAPLGIARDTLIAELKDYGAWDEAELSEMEMGELEQKIIWLAAGNIYDDQGGEIDDGQG